MIEKTDLSASDQKRLDQLFNKIEEAAKTFIGYPCNLDFDYSNLYRFLKYSINNVGDPFVLSNYHLSSHSIEREVLQFFAQLTHAGDDFWGYVTNGGTEGNMYGIYIARELYPDGIVYYSQDTHYSVNKILRILHAKNIMIRSLDNGQIDYEDLKETIQIKRDVTPIIFANIGTTMKGAIDDISKIRAILEDLAISSYYIHCDAAFSGMILPFIDAGPIFDFRNGVDSISISGHKFIGSPMPCGIAIAKKKNVDRIARFIEYIGTLDTTLSGSRNGITPLILWYAIKQKGVEGFRELVNRCLSLTDYALGCLREIGVEAWKNDYSVTLVFERPCKKIVEKWQLAPQKDIAHLIVLPHVTKEMIDGFVEDLKKSRERG